jgi:endonuclease G
MSDLEARIRAITQTIEGRDPKLGAEMKKVRETRTPRVAEAMPMGEAPVGVITPPGAMVAETIVLRTGRPVLTVARDEPLLEFSDAESEVWRERLTPAKRNIVAAVRAVGRIELANNADFDWVGTGWLVSDDIIVTNRHVAREFGERGGDGFTFRMGTRDRRQTAAVDFLEEFGRADELVFPVESILWIEDAAGPDMAFLRLTRTAASQLAVPIPLAKAEPAEDRYVAVIGYPARDPRIPERVLMESIFGKIYEKKRLAPGSVMDVSGGMLRHDCSTLGGNSGSVVFDYERGEAVGLHFSGRFLEANYAVLAANVAERLERIRAGAPDRPSRPHANGSNGSGGAATTTKSGSRTASLTVPVRITVEIGESGDATIASASAGVAGAPKANGSVAPATDFDDDFVVTEAKPADYKNRKGYDPDFLGGGAKAPMPEVTTNADDILTFDVEGSEESVLKYEHFSVVMNRRRRLCFYSAVNIDGKTSKPSVRSGWRFDPRIPSEAQIKSECYGDYPKFARGHMTRREDPVWGPKTVAQRGNTDSMHVTNAVPQMQPFNAGVWLELENYALLNAREDDQRICVFTGPYLKTNDPEYYGVRVPRSFWKVIVFIHDETNKLCATGYTMSQEDFLTDEEFVYSQFVNGEHETTQVSLRSIEQKAGVSFGKLTDLDPFGKDEEALVRPLRSVEQIRFV